MQTVKGSIAESIANIVVGYGVSFSANAVFLPILGVPISVRVNLVFGLIMTFVSFARSLLLRRAFNYMKWENINASN